jgi:hypothetical protein
LPFLYFPETNIAILKMDMRSDCESRNKENEVEANVPSLSRSNVQGDQNQEYQGKVGEYSGTSVRKSPWVEKRDGADQHD